MNILERHRRSLIVHTYQIADPRSRCLAARSTLTRIGILVASALNRSYKSDLICRLLHYDTLPLLWLDIYCVLMNLQIKGKRSPILVVYWNFSILGLVGVDSYFM